MAKYIQTDSSDQIKSADQTDTEGHKRRDVEDADPAELIDQADTEGHRRMP